MEEGLKINLFEDFFTLAVLQSVTTEFVSLYCGTENQDGHWVYWCWVLTYRINGIYCVKPTHE